MKTFDFTDDEIAAILNALYPRYDVLANPSIKNPVLAASLRSEFEDLKSAIAKFEN